MEVFKEYRFLGIKVLRRPIEDGASIGELNSREVAIGGRLPGVLFSPTYTVTDRIVVGRDYGTGEPLIRAGLERLDPSEYTILRGEKFNSAHPYKKQIFPGLKMRVVVK